MKNLATDFLSTLVFAGLYLATNDIYLATGVAIAVGIGQLVWFMARAQPIAFMQWVSLGLVIVFGTATLAFNDPRFMIVKPTIVYTIIGLIMLKRGWMARYLPPIVTNTVPAWHVDAWGYAWAGLMFALAAANLGIGLFLDHRLWAWFISVGANLAKLALFGVQYFSLRVAVTRRLQSPSEA